MNCSEIGDSRMYAVVAEKERLYSKVSSTSLLSCASLQPIFNCLTLMSSASDDKVGEQGRAFSWRGGDQRRGLVIKLIWIMG